MQDYSQLNLHNISHNYIHFPDTTTFSPPGLGPLSHEGSTETLCVFVYCVCVCVCARVCACFYDDAAFPVTLHVRT